MNASIPQIFNTNMERLAFLENASSVGYELPLNGLWTASFSLPADDPKVAYCEPLNYVEIYDGETRIDLFRIVGEDLTRSNDAYRVYSCEHVLATLLNDVMFRYHQIGGTGIRTPQVLNYILTQQTTPRWALSECDFDRRFEYSFENDNLLAALFAVPKCFDEDYEWKWDTTVYPWLLSLKAPNEHLQAEIRYRKNLLGIKKVTDASKIVNRVYALGYGEGVNQLGIESVNNGLPYVEDPVSQQRYGVQSSILVDGRYTVPENLKGYAQQIMAESSMPYISYEVEGIDRFRLDNDEYGRIWPGYLTRVVDEADGITLRTRVVNVSKSDLRADPGSIQVTLANKEQDIAGSISDLQNRALINETYAQGATNLMIQNFADNADSSHPATLMVWVPDSAVRINKMVLTVAFEPFRGYSNAVSSTTIDLTTTQSGGGSTSGSSSTSSTTSGASSVSNSTSSSVSLPPTNMLPSDDGAANAVHNHGIAANTQLAVVNSNNEITGRVSWTPSGAHYHDGHSHTVDLRHTHSVNFAHTHTLPSHTHGITMPSHSHDMLYGIYEDYTVATSATVKVDGRTMPTPAEWTEIDIINYLQKDNGGKILRDTWHKIEVLPNKQSRIVAALFTQLFTNSRGGGDY